MVPEGWRSCKLGDLFESRRERGTPGLPTVSVTLNNGLVLRASLGRKTDSNLMAEDHLLVREDDIAYNMMRMWQGASGLARFDALVSPAYVVLKPKVDVDPLFASYFFKSGRMVHLLWAYSYGLTSDRLRLYFPDFSLIPVVLPPINEQRQIGRILQTWDDAIENVTRRIINSSSHKVALIRNLLSGRHRLGGFGHPASAGDFPDNWTLISLGKLGRCITGLTYAPDDVTDQQGLLVLRSSNILGNRIVLADNVYVRKDVPEESLTRINDILVCVRNGSKDLIGKSALIDEAAAGLAHGAFMTLYRSKENLYLAYLFQSDMFLRQVRRNLGATINSINTSDLHKFKFPFPPEKERRAITSTLASVDAEIDALRRKRDCLAMEKQGLMQQLLTGKRRVRLEKATGRMAVA